MDVAYRLQFTAKDVPPIHVVSLQGRERLSKPYHFVIAGFSEELFPAQLLIGKSCTLTMTPGRESDARVVHGFVSRARVAPNTRMGRGVDVELKLSARLFQLELGRTSRIFQDLTVPEIAAQVLEGARIPQRTKLALEHVARPYCVQYAESDLSFVQRILADEGIYYYFENLDDRAGLVLCDHASHMDAAADERLEFRPGVGLGRRANEVARVAGIARARADSVTIRARDFTRPLIDLPASSASTSDGELSNLRRYEHDEDWSAGRTVEPSSRVRLEQHRRDARVAEGHSGAVRIAPGRRFQLDGAHDELGTNDVGVIWVEHRGFHPEAAAAAGHDASTHAERPVYDNRFGCVDGAVAYRPKRPARRMRQVLETATVVGPPGEEIHTDEHGRVKVRFHWDEQAQGDDRSSCWIRPAQPWAGAGYGFQFIPRVGMEVVVGFLGGDPDRPLLLGSTYNGAMRPPHPLPAEKTRSGIRTASPPGAGGHNELAFEDALGKEQVYLHAERDFDARVGRNHTVTIGGSQRVEIEESRVLQVKLNHERTVFGNEAATVGGSSVRHIVGRHVIRVQGQTDAGETKEVESVERGAQDTFQAAQSAMTAAPPGSAGPGATPALSAKTKEGARAMIGWFVEQLPEEAYPVGRLLEQRIDYFEEQLSAAEKGRSALTPTLEDVVKDAIRGAVGPDPEQLQVTKQAVQRARGRAEEALSALRAEVTTFPFNRPVFAAIKPVLEERIRAAASSATNVVAWSANVEDAIQRLHEGGGVLPTEDARRLQELLHFAPPDPVAWDSGQLAFTKQAAAKPSGERAYRLEIQGGGEILSNDGFTIRVGESVIDMTKDTISISAPKVRVDGKPILMNCPKPPEPQP